MNFLSFKTGENLFLRCIFYMSQKVDNILPTVRGGPVSSRSGNHAAEVWHAAGVGVVCGMVTHFPSMLQKGKGILASEAAVCIASQGTVSFLNIRSIH